MTAANVYSKPLNMGNMLNNCQCTGSTYYSIKTSKPDPQEIKLTQGCQ